MKMIILLFLLTSLLYGCSTTIQPKTAKIMKLAKVKIDMDKPEISFPIIQVKSCSIAQRNLTAPWKQRSYICAPSKSFLNYANQINKAHFEKVKWTKQLQSDLEWITNRLLLIQEQSRDIRAELELRKREYEAKIKGILK